MMLPVAWTGLPPPDAESEMSDLLKNIDARTRLAGTNKLEILLFTLGMDPRTGRRETFGINVFKVREVMRTPTITAAPDMPASVEGMVSLRGVLVPVVDLARYVGIGFEHRVYVKNACDKPAECVVTTDVNPEKMRGRVDANTIMTFITYRGSPASTFVASVQCELVR